MGAGGRIKADPNEKYPIIMDRVIRDKLVSRFDVLEKVKTVLLLPGTEFMSIQQLSDFYEVDERHVRMVFKEHKEEITEDGTKIFNRTFFRGLVGKVLSGDGSPFRDKEYGQYFDTYTLNNGIQMNVSNRGIRGFSRRAVLRFGMLLTQSNVAREVRNQLLNMEEGLLPSEKIVSINEEQGLLLDVGKAFASGDVNSLLTATTAYVDYQNRHIDRLKTDIRELEDKNKALQADNKVLSGESATWHSRPTLRIGVLRLSALCKKKAGSIWCELYRDLYNKYGICLKARGNAPYIQWIQEDEWGKVATVFAAMCESYRVSSSELYQKVVNEVGNTVTA